MEDHIRILQARCLTGLGSKVLLGDHGFLLRDISTNLNDLHTIQKRGGDGVKVVGCYIIRKRAMNVERLFKDVPVQTNNTRDRSTGRSMLDRVMRMSPNA